jgi:hypothetical protein
MTQPDNIFLVEGIISCLEINNGMVDHLAEINKNHQQKNATVGTLSALAGNDGQAATSVLINTYGGELTQVFTCLLGDKLMRGRFSGSQWLKEGNHVKAAVSQDGKDLYAHGIMDEAQGLLWCGYFQGTRASFMEQVKSEIDLSKKMIIAMPLVFFLGAAASKRGIQSYFDNFIPIIFGSILLSVALPLLMIGWAYLSPMGIEIIPTKVFELFGFDDPKNVNLSGYSFFRMGVEDSYYEEHNISRNEYLSNYESEESSMNVYYYKKALKDRRIKMASENK